MTQSSDSIIKRAGCRDIWNASMVEGAVFGKYDIPYCPTTATHLPASIITWEEAKHLHRKHLSSKEFDYHENSFVCWYLDDFKFEGGRGIWHNLDYVLKVLRHFEGAITPDFSTYQDFPEALKIYATYRMRAFGYWLSREGIRVINNIRWGTAETYKFTYEGAPKNSMVAIGTVGGGPRKLADRPRFEEGLYKMVEVLEPHTIIVYGSAKGECFDVLRKRGIQIVSYPSKTAQAFERRKKHE